MAELVNTRKDGIVWHVVMNRADKRNALTNDMVFQIAGAVKDVDNYPDVRAVVLSGEGPIFSAGVDIGGLMAGRAEIGESNTARWLRRMADRLQDALHVIESTEVPVIAAIHGQVIGLGLELALACDFRVCTADAKLSIPESRMGLVADVGGTTRLCRTVGPSRAKDMLMTARALGAEEALVWGLANRIAENGKHVEAAVDLANEIAKNAPLAVGRAKLLVDQGSGVSKATQLALERWAQSQLITTGDVMEAATAFMEKRDPQFKGE